MVGRTDHHGECLGQASVAANPPCYCCWNGNAAVEERVVHPDCACWPCPEAGGGCHRGCICSCHDHSTRQRVPALASLLSKPQAQGCRSKISHCPIASQQKACMHCCCNQVFCLRPKPERPVLCSIACTSVTDVVALLLLWRTFSIDDSAQDCNSDSRNEQRTKSLGLVRLALARNRFRLSRGTGHNR